MPLSLDFAGLMRSGYIKSFQMINGDTKVVPEAKHWLILYGVLAHITGTDTFLYIKEAGGRTKMIWKILSAVHTWLGPLFSTWPSDSTTAADQSIGVPAYSPIIMEAGDYLSLACGNVTNTQICVLEW